MLEQFDQAQADTVPPPIPMRAGRRKSGDAEWDDPDALANEEVDEELDEDDDLDEDEEDFDEDEEDFDEDEEEEDDFDEPASLDELEDEESYDDDEREDWDA